MPHDYNINGDPVSTYLVFSNSHDGSGSIRVAITPIRVVCQNTLNLALSEAQRTWTTIHVGEIKGKLQEAQKTLLLSEHYMKMLQTTAAIMATKSLSDKKVLESINELLPIPENAGAIQANNIDLVRTDIKLRYHEAPEVRSFVLYEKENILIRARTISSSSLISRTILGSLMSFVVFYGNWGWKGILINAPFIMFMLYYFLFKRDGSDSYLACICVIIGDFYLIIIFSLIFIFLLNLIQFGNEVMQMKLAPAIWPIIGTAFLSILAGPLYTQFIIKRKIYKEPNKTNLGIIAFTSIAGMAFGRLFVSNFMFLVLSLISCLLISFLIMALHYYIYVYKLLLKITASKDTPLEVQP